MPCVSYPEQAKACPLPGSDALDGLASHRRAICVLVELTIPHSSAIAWWPLQSVGMTELTPPPRPYVSVNVSRPARNALQRLTLNVSAAAGRRLTLSEVLLGAVAVAKDHPDEHVAAIASLIGETPE